jgi:cell division protein FtsQ
MKHEAVSDNKKTLKTCLKTMIVLTLISVSGYFIYHTLLLTQTQQGSTKLQLKWLRQTNLTSMSAVHQSTAEFLKQPLIQISPETMQQQLLALPWIKQAHIQKKWPNQLQVMITEHQPLAQFNQDLWITTDGSIIKAPKTSQLNQLPQFYGETKDAKALIAFFKTINQPIHTIHQHVNTLTLDHRDAWHLKLNNNLTLYLGRKNRVQKIQKFIEIYPQLKKDLYKIEYIDLRYDSGLAIGYKPDIQEKEIKHT